MEKGGNEEEPREQPEQRGRQPPTTEGKGSVVDLDFTTANPLAAIDIDELNPEPIGPLRSADDQSDSIPRPVISETSQPTMVTALSKLCKPWRSAQDNRESQTVKKKGGKEIPSLLHWEGIVPGRQNTRRKDFQLGTLRPLSQGMLADPEEWFLQFEKALAAQVVHPSEQATVLIHSLAPSFQTRGQPVRREPQPLGCKKTCFYCGKPGHIQRECRAKTRDMAAERGDGRPLLGRGRGRGGGNNARGRGGYGNGYGNGRSLRRRRPTLPRDVRRPFNHRKRCGTDPCDGEWRT
eukprot:GHVQ01012196.1.p1 GENE.GHVQ01012196.1~~GHVQ01012196.1.p1  ORF type:complete len:293 (+),score=27.14 GHVQ01012196.1:385-1263(+)